MAMRTPVLLGNAYGKGYGEAGASQSRRALKGFTAESFSAREDIDMHVQLLRERSRILYMSSPVATSAIKTLRTNVVGEGLTLKSRVNRKVLEMTDEEADTFERHVEEEFSLWAENKNACDATGMNDFYSMTQLVLVTQCLSGDAIVLPRYEEEASSLLPYSLRLQILEADRVSTPTLGNFPYLSYFPFGKNEETGNYIYDGVEVNVDGKVVAYHVMEGAYFFGDTVKWTRVEAYGKDTGLPNVIQVLDTERPEQYRGVPLLAQAIEPILQLRRFVDAELTSAVTQSMFAFFIQTEADPSRMPLGETTPSGEREEYDASEYNLGGGTIPVFKPGERLEMLESKRPSSGFDGFVRAMCTQIGAAFEIPVDLLLKEFNASYSASRAALLEAWKSFRMRRRWLVNDFCKPVYELWFYEAVASGRIHAPGFFTDPRLQKAYLKADWVGPAPGQLDPVKEVTAHILAREAGYETTEQGTVEMSGNNFESNIQQIKTENQRMAEAGLIKDPELLKLLLEIGLQSEEEGETAPKTKEEKGNGQREKAPDDG